MNKKFTFYLNKSKYFSVGRILRPLDDESYQFSGQVTNINIFRGEKYILSDLAFGICQQNVSPDIPWEAMRWDQLGGSENLDIGEIDLEEICARVSEEPVTLPLIWNFNTALETCKKLGNGKITGFVHPENLSEVDFMALYGNKYKGCEYFWTPYSDEKEEGHYYDVYTEDEISSFDWESGQPNGERIENILGLTSRINKFRDIDKEADVCASCTVPHKVVYMRGVCKHSYLGMLSCPTL